MKAGMKQSRLVGWPKVACSILLRLTRTELSMNWLSSRWKYEETPQLTFMNLWELGNKSWFPTVIVAWIRSEVLFQNIRVTNPMSWPRRIGRYLALPSRVDFLDVQRILSWAFHQISRNQGGRKLMQQWNLVSKLIGEWWIYYVFFFFFFGKTYTTPNFSSGGRIFFLPPEKTHCARETGSLRPGNLNWMKFKTIDIYI